MIRKQLKVKSVKDAQRVLKEMNEDYRFDTFDALDFLTYEGNFIGTIMFDSQMGFLRFVRISGELAVRDKAIKRNTKGHRVCSVKRRHKNYDGRKATTPLFEC